ncbi:MAG: DUF4145 domain-containing protein [Planctomycetes bacterium]|nr:DUF4145 domain-containing protein [Planctomycetota bacterium]
MPDDALKDYSEAAEVVACSPRAAAALLRLSVQRLCVHLGGDGKNLNDDIGQLVAEKRLHPTIQQSLDVVRVIGNGMVHPGQIADDSAKTVSKLFGLINVVVNQTISAEKEVQAQFEDLPEDKKLQIQKRDAASGLT